MGIYYLETSALLKRYRTEKGTDVIDELFRYKEASELFVTSYFTALEITSVATRLFRGNSITRNSCQQLLGELADDLKEFILLEPVTDPILSEALNLITSYGLRAPDSVQLSTAIKVMAGVKDQPFHFVCSDSRLKSACKVAGLPVIDPEGEDSIEALKCYRSGAD